MNYMAICFGYIIAILMFFVGRLVTSYMSRHKRVNRPHKRKNSSTNVLINNACRHVSKYTGVRMCVLPLMQYVFLDTNRTPIWLHASCSTKHSVSTDVSVKSPFWFKITVYKLHRTEKNKFRPLYVCFCVIAIITSKHFSLFYNEHSPWLGKDNFFPPLPESMSLVTQRNHLPSKSCNILFR